MAVADMASGPLLFVQQWHEHARKVYEGVELIRPLVNALSAQDEEKSGVLHGQISKIASEADQIKLALYDQIKDMHFRSPGSYAFSRYVDSQNKMLDSARDFADLLMLRKTTIPIELRVGFLTLIAHIVNISGQMINLAKEFSSPVAAVSADPQAQDAREAIAGILEDTRRTRQLEMEFAQHVYRLERQLDPVTILVLDRYCMALRKITDAAECATNHLRLMIP